MGRIRRVHVDLNRRNREGQVVAPYQGPTPHVGERVIAYEPEDGVRAEAVIKHVDVNRCVVAMDVDWPSMTEDGVEVNAVEAQPTTGSRQPSISGDRPATGGSAGGQNLLVTA